MSIELFEILESGSMRLATEITQDFDDVDFSVITAFDEIIHSSPGVTPDTANNTITVNKDGLYEVHMGFLFSFPGTEEIEVVPFVNGTAYSSVGAGLQGRSSTKPVSFY